MHHELYTLLKTSLSWYTCHSDVKCIFIHVWKCTKICKEQQCFHVHFMCEAEYIGSTLRNGTLVYHLEVVHICACYINDLIVTQKEQWCVILTMYGVSSTQRFLSYLKL